MRNTLAFRPRKGWKASVLREKFFYRLILKSDPNA